MCGLAGIVAIRDHAEGPSVEALARMAGALRHRGPDELGVYCDARGGLAHARLSIIDLAGGQQPLANEDETLWVAFNGEIFNYLELRVELTLLGHRFRTASDTEVIVHAFESWGLDALARFNGQFALALWDARRRSLVLARDPFGIHPLYLTRFEGRLLFASEVKALFAGEPRLPRGFDHRGLAHTFTFWSIVPPQSVFEGIEEIEPGTAQIFEAGESRRFVHFAPRRPLGRDGLFRGTLDEATEATRAALERATRLRMLRADVPVGSYLSGGLDSSLIAALGLAAKGAGFSTFSMRFSDAEYDETQFQREMAARLGSEHHEVVIRRQDIAEVFPAVIAHTERPVLRTAPAPLFLLSRLVREAGIKVVLTGEGADEMFAGYDLFREGKVRRFWARHPESPMRPRLLERLYPYLARSPVAQRAMARQFFGRDLERYREPGFAHGPRWHSTASVRRLLSPEVRHEIEGLDVQASLLADLPSEASKWSGLAQDQYLEVRTLLSGYLLSSQGDRMLMAHSVEGRFPFLDPEVARLADSLPDHYKLRVLDEKHVLKRLSRGLVPPAILARKKQPYRAPDALAFVAPELGSPPAWVDAVIAESAVRAAGVFEPRAVAGLWNKCLTRAGAQLSNADNMALTAVLSTQLLHQIFGRRTETPPVPALRTLVDRRHCP
jgi:asparagine synthase (glutamine-hydrolysing)